MIDIGFDGIEIERFVGRFFVFCGGKDIGDRYYFGIIVSLSVGFVYFNIVDIKGIYISFVKNLVRKDRLCWFVRMSDGDGISRVVGGCI